MVGDSMDEPDETFFVDLSNVTGGSVGGTGRTTVTILDDDPTPALTISNVTAYEGHSGLTNVVFNVTLSAASGRTVRVSYATANGTAAAGSDYGAVSGQLQFAPGSTSLPITVPIYGDTLFEANETFVVNLSSPVDATIADGQGLGTILNDDAARMTWGDFYVPRDGSADAALLRPSTGVWTVKDSNTGNTTTFGPLPLTQATDIPVPADYTGDGLTDCAVYRPASGQWTVAPSCGTTGQYSPVWGGDPSDVPVPADYDGDGRADLAVYRRATNYWHVAFSSGGSTAVEWGWNWTHVIPTPGDYDGDGRADFIYYAGFNGSFWILRSSDWTVSALDWGVPGGTVVPVPADYDGDSRLDLAYFYPANAGWYILPSTTGVGPVLVFGTASMTPVPADYDLQAGLSESRSETPVGYSLERCALVEANGGWGRSVGLAVRGNEHSVSLARGVFPRVGSGYGVMAGNGGYRRWPGGEVHHSQLLVQVTEYSVRAPKGFLGASSSENAMTYERAHWSAFNVAARIFGILAAIGSVVFLVDGVAFVVSPDEATEFSTSPIETAIIHLALEDVSVHLWLLRFCEPVPTGQTLAIPRGASKDTGHRPKSKSESEVGGPARPEASLEE